MPGPRVAARCAAHPARPAVDACPVCGRGRCGADRQRFAAAGCAFCAGAAPVATPPGRAELVVRAGLAGFWAALAGGWIGTQYVRVHLMSLLAPAVGGLAAAWATQAATGRRRRGVRAPALAVAAVAAVVGAALAFRVTPGGGLSVVHPLGRVGPPYLMALAGVVLWPAVFAPPRGRQPAGPDGDDDGDTAS